MRTDRDDDIEIDLKHLFFALKRRFWIIVLVVILGASATMLYTTMLMEPVYTSSTMLYILNKTNNITSLSDLQLGTQLTKDYKILITSRPVLNQVIDNLNLNLSYQQLGKKVAVNNPTDTRILTISVNDINPEIARTIADEIAAISVERIETIMDDSTLPKIVEEANLPQIPVSPSVKKNTALGGVVAGVLAAGITIILYILNDSIRTTEDLERYLGLNTLGVIPYFDEGKKIEKKSLLKRKRKAVSE